MTKVLFKKGPSQLFDTDKDLNSIIFKKSTNPQAPGFSEIYLGDNRCGVGHNFSIGSDGLVPAPTMADIGKVLTPNGWIDLSNLSGVDGVRQHGIESSNTYYPILLKGNTGLSDYTGEANFLTTSTSSNRSILEAKADGSLMCKNLYTNEGDVEVILGNITLFDMPDYTGGKELRLESAIYDSSTPYPSPALRFSRFKEDETSTDIFTDWVIQNSNAGVLTFTPEKSNSSTENPFVSILSNVTATSFTVSGTSSADTYVKANGGGAGGVFTGAGESAGSAGLVPAPAIGDAGKYLKGDGTWGDIQGGTQSDWEEDDSTDPSYVQNRPAVRAGTGTNAVIVGDLTNNVASGQYSYAEGDNTKAFGEQTHSEGIGTVAYGDRSHAEGFGYGHEPNNYPDAPFKITGNANATSYTVDTTEGIYRGMVLYYNGVYTSVSTSIPNMTPPRVFLTNTLDSENALSNATVKIVTGTASGLQSHSEGGSTRAYGTSSHTEGNHTLAINLYEHSQGSYNKSNQAISTFGDAGNTLNSIGIGTSESTRKNAVEVMQNGDVYVYGVGDYDGTNPGVADTLQDAINNASMDLAIPVTYSELVTLKTGGNLVPGMQYRITDYTCTTTQSDTQSAGHVFDIIVTADSETELNENARAAHHSGDTYFQNCNLDAWELKYCLENDTNRFTWADTTNGKGVIYYMKDEWNNIATFDFKNMLFTRSTTWFNSHQSWTTSILGSVPSTNMNFYFLSWVTQSNEVQDLSIVGQTLANDEGMYSGVFNNEIKGTTAYDMGIAEDETSVTFVLPCTVMVSSYAYEEGIFYGCYGNSFGDTCINNTFGSGCRNNTFGNGCRNNTFGGTCCDNSFGHRFVSNTSEYGFENNTFGNACYNNSFGNDFISNSFGNECNSNTFGKNCEHNTLGNNCSNNTLGNNCINNSFGNNCIGNTFGISCKNITVFDNVLYCNITGGTSSTPVKNAQILNGTKGTSTSNKLTITFEANKDYTQVAGLVNGTTLRIWIAEDTVTGPSSSTSNHIAVFDGTSGKIVKDGGVAVSDLVNVQSDWEEDDNTDPAYVQNRPAVRAGDGNNAVIEGDITNNIASGQYSHAEGTNTMAKGVDSHAEGYGTVAWDDNSHAEGYGFSTASATTTPFKLTTMMLGSPFYTIDIPWDESFVRRVIYYNGIFTRIMSGGLNPNDNTYWIRCENEISTETITNAEVLWVPAASYLQAHTEGVRTTATGNGSHAEGHYTIAINNYEHAQGNYNNPHKVNTTFGDAGNTLNSIGIGTSESTRKNAVEVMQNGDVYVYGLGSYDGTNPNTTGVSSIQSLINNLPEYTIEKLNQAETGYISSYVLKKDGTQVGNTINIPKDYLVKSGSVVEVVLYNGHYYESADTGHTTQLDGYGVDEIGKYLKFVVNTADSQAGTGNTSYIYIAVQDLADVYTEGNGIDINSANVVSIQIDTPNANGLQTTNAGLKLTTATQSAAGAMSAADKVKLDSINGNYWGSQTLSASASYITTPEFKQVTINGSTTDVASTDHCVMVYDTTNKCLKFTF